MSGKKIIREYQQSLIDAYYDFRMHEIFDPFYDAFQQWKLGKLNHDDITDLIHKVHKENQEIYKLFTQGHNWLITCIKMDSDWYSKWLQCNPPPPGVDL